MYCQVLLIGLNLSDISGLMKLSCFEDVARKDSDFIYIKVAIYDSDLICLKYARVYTWEYNRAGGDLALKNLPLLCSQIDCLNKYHT